MVFNDIVNNKVIHMQELNRLDSYIEIVESLILEYETIAYNLIDYCSNFHGGYKDINTIEEVKQSQKINKYINTQINKIDLFELNDIIRDIIKNNEENLDTDFMFNKILDEFNNMRKMIYSYLKLDDWDKARQCKVLINEFRILINDINNYKSNNIEIIAIGDCIENKYELKEEEVEFSIQLHNSNMTLKDITLCIDIISSIYERCCNMFEVSVSDYELKPIKLESGSLLEKIIGNKTVFSFIEDLLGRAIGFIYRNYTNEGKIKGEINKIELLKEEINFLDICENHGIDTTKAKDTLNGNINALSQDIYKLTAKSNVISINRNKYDRDKEISQQIIEQTKRLSIESKQEVATTSENVVNK
ncbi:MAG: hypothetical protein ACLU7E_07470 [Clostridium butyricum]